MLCRYALPMIFGYAGFITTNRYLQAQGIVRPQVVSGIIVLVLHPLINWLFIYQFGKLADVRVIST